MHFVARTSLGLLLVVLAGAWGLPAAAVAAPATSKDRSALLARADELWKNREDPAALAQNKRILDQALIDSPADYEWLWRAAVWNFWCSDEAQRPKDERVKLAKTAWDLSERAVTANPGGVEGHFFSAAAMGNYSLGIGILRALGQRIEGKFTTRLSEADRINPNFAHGGIAVAWGRYHASLPWPKYSEKKATAAYQRALAINPDNLRARVYWAELLLEEDHPSEAKRLLDEVMQAHPGKYDAPEERRAKAMAQALLVKVTAALKN